MRADCQRDACVPVVAESTCTRSSLASKVLLRPRIKKGSKIHVLHSAHSADSNGAQKISQAIGPDPRGRADILNLTRTSKRRHYKWTLLRCEPQRVRSVEMLMGGKHSYR